MNKSIFLVLFLPLFFAACAKNQRIRTIEHLIAGDSLRVWDWDTDDMCEKDIYPCRGIVFYTNHTLIDFRYFWSNVDTSKLLRHTNPIWSCMPRPQTWEVLNDTLLLYKGDTCRIVTISADSFLISLKINNYTEDNMMKYIKPHLPSYPMKE